MRAEQDDSGSARLPQAGAATAPDPTDRPADRTAAEVAGLDALELAGETAGPSWLTRAWAAAWPKLAALALVLTVWQLLASSGWKPDYVLPGPWPTLQELGSSLGTPRFWESVAVTLQRALLGFAAATVLGLALGVAVARVSALRSAIGSLITGLQTMPSIAWFPLALLLFQNEAAIYFVVILGAAPSVANGVISGVDYVSPVLLRAAANLGAKGWRLYWHVVMPASLPSIFSGLKQGWAFAWRSLMAGELLVPITGRSSIGFELQSARDFNDAQALFATLIVILIIGILVDMVFNVGNRIIRRRWGVVDTAA